MSGAAMPQKPIELILMRQLAGTLATPIFLVDPAGTLVFYNPPAERVLGLRFDETGEMPLDEWSRLWRPTDDAGNPMPPERVPLAITLAERRPAHGAFWIAALDGARRRIETTSIPLIAVPDTVVGAAAIFWEAG
jgi:PAS domain-containing protein